jgi:hypothetical protein
MLKEADDHDGSGWPRYAAWTIWIALGTAVATKLGEWVIEEVKARVKSKKEPKR